MKLGIIVDAKPESFVYAEDKGLEFLEFTVNIGSDVDAFVKSVPELVEASRKTGVGVGSLGRWGTERILPDGSVSEEELEASYKLIDAAQALSCPNFVCGCNYVEDLSYYENCTAAIEYFSKLIAYGRERNVQISVYNCRWNSFVHSPMAWELIVGHLPELGIKYDPSHARYAGGDYLKEAVEWGHRFRHVHLKGSLMIDGKRVDDPPAGLDQTDWGSFMAILYEKKYQGGLSIEPHSETWSGELGDKGVDYTIGYMKKLLFRA